MLEFLPNNSISGLTSRSVIVLVIGTLHVTEMCAKKKKRKEREDILCYRRMMLFTKESSNRILK